MSCDKDCFHCIYEDCILDSLDHQDYLELSRIETDFINPKTQKQKNVAAQQKAYYEANREKLTAYQKAYYEANREKVAAQQKAYREANREKVAAYQEAYYEANREKLTAYHRAYCEANREKAGAKEKGMLLKSARKEHGYTQRELADLCGITQQTVSLMETGGIPIRPELFESVFYGFGSMLCEVNA